MAEHAENLSADGTGPVDRRPAAGRSRVSHKPQLAPVLMGMDNAAIPTQIEPDAAAAALALPPDILPRLIKTQASYRFLVSSGLTGAEAAGLIGYVTGLNGSHNRWTLGQVNRMLFLRAQYTETKWGEAQRRAE